MSILLPLLLASITCTPRGDGTWVCSSNDDYVGVTTNGEGIAVCTNCVAMTPEQCQQLKSQVLIEVDWARDVVSNAIVSVESASDGAFHLYEAYFSFTACPYSPNLATAVSTQLIDQVVTAWTECPNRLYLNLPTYTSAQSQAAAQRPRIYNYIVGMWQASYEAAQSAMPQLQTIRTSANNSITQMAMVRDSIDNIEVSANQITCAQCQLGSGSSSGSGGTGSETGCAECYLQILREIKSSVSSFNTDFNKYANYVTNKINRLFSDYNNATQLLDNDNIHIPLDYYDEQVFGTADEPKFDQTQFERLNYFSRIELLLAHIAGVTTNSVDSFDGQRGDAVTNALMSVTNDFMLAVNVVSNATASFIGLTSSLQDAIETIQNAFGSAAPLTQGIELLPANKWIGDSPLTLNIPVDIQTTSHTICSCIIYVGALVGAWLLVSAIWEKVIAVLRWVFSLLSP